MRSRSRIDALWGLITLVIILGGILGGVFTAIEAGAVACVWAFLVTMFIYRDYRWRDLPALVHRTLRTVAMVLTLIACASSVGYVMALTQMPAKITAFFLTISSDKNVILLLINVMLLVLGCLLDMAPSILICTPILLPVMMNFGVNPVHFGIIMMLNLGIGLCHPPVGAILFVGCAVGKVTIEEVMRKIWPFYAVMLVGADAGDLFPGDFALAAAAARAVKKICQFLQMFNARLGANAQPRRSAVHMPASTRHDGRKACHKHGQNSQKPRRLERKAL